CLWGSGLLRPPTLRRSTPRGCGRFLGRRMAEPLCGRTEFVRTVPPSRQLALPRGGGVLSSMSGGRGASGETHAHLHWSSRRLDAGGKLLPQDCQLGRRRAVRGVRCLSRRAPWILL